MLYYTHNMSPFRLSGQMHFPKEVVQHTGAPAGALSYTLVSFIEEGVWESLTRTQQVIQDPETVSGMVIVIIRQGVQYSSSLPLRGWAVGPESVDGAIDSVAEHIPQ